MKTEGELRYEQEQRAQARIGQGLSPEEENRADELYDLLMLQHDKAVEAVEKWLVRAYFPREVVYDFNFLACSKLGWGELATDKYVPCDVASDVGDAMWMSILKLMQDHGESEDKDVKKLPDDVTNLPIGIRMRALKKFVRKIEEEAREAGHQIMVYHYDQSCVTVLDPPANGKVWVPVLHLAQEKANWKEAPKPKSRHVHRPWWKFWGTRDEQ